MSPFGRRKVILKENTDLSLTRQCERLESSRETIYFTPVGLEPTMHNLMQEIDRVIYEVSFLWQPPDCGSPSPIRVLDWASTLPSPDEHHRTPGYLHRAKHRQKAP